MALETVEGIVIRGIDYGETHKILTIYTYKYGKFSCMIRGVKKPQSRLAALSHLFTRANFLIALGRQGMGRIEQGEVLQSYRNIREDLVSTAYATYIVELLNRCVEEREPSESIYRFLQGSLQQLADGQDAEIICRIFEMKALQLLGVRPILDVCVNCRQAVHPFQHFHFAEGGVICPVCAGFTKHVRSIHKETWKLLIVFQTIPIDRLRTVAIRSEIKQELRFILWYFLDHFAGVTLKSRHFLEQIERLL
ncbi:DNA repair protein RecO [Fodinisporobacter ferrooxydans]|uniref:DNA repair protein RecO n=1 Tax=Fodinisporobacter ferrooxydans TaxID=2901836 RepID=A0ABY4CEH3_9BACL|nr:DNA repair protein RecO [Alicyclobacillaceae bacterium MYW30-H2]